MSARTDTREGFRWPQPGFSLSQEFYHSPEVFDREMETVFGSGWFCVGVAADIPNKGDFVSFEIGAEPLMAVHGQDGVIRVLSRVCQHRAMYVVTGSGNAKRFSCPYHKWTYSTDGSLVGAPLMDGAAHFDKRQCGLPTLPVEIWNGFIFTTFAKEPVSFSNELAAYTRQLEHYAMGTWTTRVVDEGELDANWKVIMENGVESYHHLGAHLSTLQSTSPAQHSRVGDMGFRYASHHNFDHDVPIEKLADPVTVTPEELAEFEGRVRQISTVFPNLIFAATEGGGFFAVVYPLSIERSVFRIWAAQDPARPDLSQERRTAHLANPDDLILAVNQQDIDMFTGVTKATKSRLYRGGPLSPIEAPLEAFYRFIKAAMDA